jgi:hypothetical protein
VYIDDYSGCVPSGDTGFSATCSASRELAVPNSGAFPCTLPTNAEVGRLSRSSDGAITTFYCYRQLPGTTMFDTNAVDPFNGTGIIGRLQWDGSVDTTLSVGVDRVGAGNELDGGMLPCTAGAEPLFPGATEYAYWLTGNR